MKNIEALIFTDLHLNDINKEDCLSFIDKVLDYAKINKVPRIIFMGDMVDVRRGPSSVSLLSIQKIFEKISVNFKDKFDYIPGNHDKFIEDSEDSYLELFTHYCPNLHKKLEIISSEKYSYLFFTNDSAALIALEKEIEQSHKKNLMVC